ncbi:glycosyltransferase family A protein [Vibrio fluvialis]|uniref:glycosyltransferase family A protein n=1 Tax=Vibrio fluvialis TaxID=676 RepID=UPI003D0C0148
MRISNITAVITTISARYIERQLEQVCKQIERVIVCCDRDVPELTDIAGKYGCEIVFTGGVGQGKAREIGVALVTTEFVHVIDDDDWLADCFYPSSLSGADVWFTNSIWVLKPNELRKIFDNKTYVNVSCHIVKTSVMKACLAKFRDFVNIGEDHFYYDFFSDYTVARFDGVLMRLMMKQRRPQTIDNDEQKRQLAALIEKPCKSNSSEYESLLNDYKTANRYGLCTLFNA